MNLQMQLWTGDGVRESVGAMRRQKGPLANLGSYIIVVMAHSCLQDQVNNDGGQEVQDGKG